MTAPATARAQRAALPFEAQILEARPGARPLLQQHPDGEALEAKLAVAGTYAPAVGDRVLCLSAEDCTYIVGVLRALRPVEAAVYGRDGSRAYADERGRLRVEDHEGALLFEHEAGASVLHAPRGALSFRAPGGLHFASDGPISLEGDSLSLRGRVLDSAFERIHTSAEALETRAGRIVERARETYREVEELAQLRAERLRFVAKKTLHAFGQRTLVKAEEDVKVKGEKIYLG